MPDPKSWNAKTPLLPVNPRRQVLTEWRRIDLEPEEKAARSGVRSAAEITPNVARHMGLERRQVEAEVARVWNHLLDPNITAHAQPTGMHKGTLFITVDSNSWLDEIVRYRYDEILQRLHHSFGSDLIARISFRAG